MEKTKYPDLKRPIRIFRRSDNQTLVTFSEGLRRKGQKKVPCRFSKEYNYMRNYFKDVGISLIKIRMFFPEIKDYPITLDHPLFGELFMNIYYKYNLGEDRFGWEYLDE